ncbi:hypothetical protein SDC9_111437 [bioreactor metagenome]|uniref:Uncharacterized protein n=1 Tax=bioreactor metagenome TaxID=1076179 RepID=A0A645BGI0_9ZZZZ
MLVPLTLITPFDNAIRLFVPDKVYVPVFRIPSTVKLLAEALADNVTVCPLMIVVVLCPKVGTEAAATHVMLSVDSSHVEVLFQFPLCTLRKYFLAPMLIPVMDINEEPDMVVVDASVTLAAGIALLPTAFRRGLFCRFTSIVQSVPKLLMLLAELLLRTEHNTFTALSLALTVIPCEKENVVTLLVPLL